MYFYESDRKVIYEWIHYNRSDNVIKLSAYPYWLFIPRKMSSKRLADKVDELFKHCSNHAVVDFRSICKVFWTTLDNSLSIIDLAGIFALSVSGSKSEALDTELFLQFLNGVGTQIFLQFVKISNL